MLVFTGKTDYNPIYMNDIIRQEFFDRLKAYKDKHIIKVVTGIRRCGKSTLLKMFRNYLIENGAEQNQIIFLNFEDFDNYELLNPHKLHEYVKNRIVNGKMMYVFFDEIQNVSEFQRVVDSLFLNENIDLYMTGSNAYLLSGELEVWFVNHRSVGVYFKLIWLTVLAVLKPSSRAWRTAFNNLPPVPTELELYI